MLITILMGGVYFMENPMNSLLGMHPRYVWLVELLQLLGIPFPWLMRFFNCWFCTNISTIALCRFWIHECNHLRPTKWRSG